MSHPNLRRAFTRTARQNLRDIAQYSLEQWGEEQQGRYMAALERGVLALLDRPDIGRA